VKEDAYTGSGGTHCGLRSLRAYPEVFARGPADRLTDLAEDEVGDTFGNVRAFILVVLRQGVLSFSVQ
jgi:hypothetical protein